MIIGNPCDDFPERPRVRCHNEFTGRYHEKEVPEPEAGHRPLVSDVRVVGTCSKCKGPVVQSKSELKVGAPSPPYCERCGATPKNPYGPTIPME